MNSLRARVDGTDFKWEPPSTSELVLLAHKVKGHLEVRLKKSADWIKD